MMAGRGDALPVSALPVDGTYPSGTTAFEKRNISELVAEWDPELCIQCGNCSFVCPHSVIRSKFYDESALAGAPDGFPSMPLDARGLPDTRYSLAGLRGGLHRLRVVRGGLPGAGAGRTGAAGHQPGAAGAAGRAGAGANIAFFEALPVERPVPGGLRHRARHPVPAAAVRVLRRLRGLRRDPLPQAAVPAVRRPADDRERDRLLVDLRRQPADHAVDDQRRGPRPGLVQLAVRGQRRVRAGLPARRRPAPAAGPRPAGPSCASRSARTWWTSILAAPQRRESELAAQRDRVAELARRLAALDAAEAPGRRPAQRARITWSGAASGWSAGTAGPTTSAPAAWTTCWPAAATSTCWCSTPRCTRTPAASRPRPPRSARWPSSPRRARRCPRRTWPCRRSRTATCTWPGWRWAPTRSRRCGRCARRRPTTGPSLVIAYSHCIAHGIEMRDGHGPAVPGGGQRVLAADPLRPGAARRRATTRSCSTRRGRASRWPTTPAGSCGTASWPSADPAEAERLHGLAEQQVAAALGHLRGDGHPRRRPVPAGRAAAGTVSPLGSGGAPDGPVLTSTWAWRCATRWSHRRRRWPGAVDGVRALARRRAWPPWCCRRCSRRNCGARRARDAAAGRRRARESFAESLSYFPAAAEAEARPRRYLSLVERAAAAVDVPVIASLNGVTTGGWTGLRRVRWRTRARPPSS